jgi:peptidoglycan hydrolase-like protein with peptidoglycan-binding domain
MPAQATITGSVGSAGMNRRADVETVQRLLNATGTNLKADGSCGPKTIAAIRLFQSGFSRMPDGRVDPNGETLRRLVNAACATPGLNPPAGSAAGLPLKLNCHTIETFVSKGHDIKYKAVPDTKKLVETIMPYYPKEIKVIGAYLDDADQYWKVNYHWELLLSKINKALASPVSAANRTKIEALYKTMLINPPNPQTGYMASKVMGYPKDSSTDETIKLRHATVKSCKEQFKPLMQAEGLPGKYPDGPMWDLAVAPVAVPGQSTHGKGYALDIFGTGQNAKIKEISAALGATMTFDEKSHVHVEFKNGVKTNA